MLYLHSNVQNVMFRKKTQHSKFLSGSMKTEYL